MESTQVTAGAFKFLPFFNISHTEESLEFSVILVSMAAWTVCKHTTREDDLGDNNSVDLRNPLL